MTIYCPWKPSFTKLKWKRLLWVCLSLSMDANCPWEGETSSETTLCSWSRCWGAGTCRLSANHPPQICHPKLSWKRNWVKQALIYCRPSFVPLRYNLGLGNCSFRILVGLSPEGKLRREFSEMNNSLCFYNCLRSTVDTHHVSSTKCVLDFLHT